MIERIALVGCGLIGGSFSLALREHGLRPGVVGAGRSESNLKLALARGIVDEIAPVAEAVADADLVMIAVPMRAVSAVLDEMAPVLREDTIVTDAGSVKGSFVAEARLRLNSMERVVPGHPIAGTEHTGAAAAFPELFERRKVILTPLDETEPLAIQIVRELWEKCGAHVEQLSVRQHDEILALTSHLPHVLAYTLVEGLSAHNASEAVFRYAAGGFRDFTRIAASNPEMWRDVCATNREAVLDALDYYIGRLQRFRVDLQSEDYQSIYELFERSKTERESHSAWLE